MLEKLQANPTRPGNTAMKAYCGIFMEPLKAGIRKYIVNFINKFYANPVIILIRYLDSFSKELYNK